MAPLRAPLPMSPPRRHEVEPPTSGELFWGKSKAEPHVPMSVTQFPARELGHQVERMTRSKEAKDAVSLGSTLAPMQRRQEFETPSSDRLVHRPLYRIGGANQKTHSDVYLTNEHEVRRWYDDSCQSMSHRQFIPPNLGGDATSTASSSRDTRHVSQITRERSQKNHADMMRTHFPVGSDAVDYTSSMKSQFGTGKGSIFDAPVSTPPVNTGRASKFHSDVPIKNLNVNWGDIAKPTTHLAFPPPKCPQRAKQRDDIRTYKHSWSIGEVTSVNNNNNNNNSANKTNVAKESTGDTSRWVTTTKNAFRGVEFEGGSGSKVARSLMFQSSSLPNGLRGATAG